MITLMSGSSLGCRTIYSLRTVNSAEVTTEQGGESQYESGSAKQPVTDASAQNGTVEIVHPDTATNDIERTAYASIDEDIDAAIIEMQRVDYVGADMNIVNSDYSMPYESGLPRYDRLSEKQKNMCDSLAVAARNYEYYKLTSDEYGGDVIVPALEVDTAYSYMYTYESSYSCLDFFGYDYVDIIYFDPDGNANNSIAYDSDELESIKDKMEYMDAVANRIIERMPKGLSTYLKYYYLGLVLCNHCDYDTKGEHGNAHTAYGALTQGVVVCEGYSKAYQYLCRKADLYCALESGYSKGTGHMWNLIALESGTYHVDLTWSDAYDATDYRWFFYFAKSEEEIETDHRLDADNSYIATGRSLYE